MDMVCPTLIDVADAFFHNTIMEKSITFFKGLGLSISGTGDEMRK